MKKKHLLLAAIIICFPFTIISSSYKLAKTQIKVNRIVKEENFKAILVKEKIYTFNLYRHSIKIDTTKIKLWDTGNLVTHIQERLLTYGYEITVDGIYGYETYNAVYDFQSRLKLPHNGVVDSYTMALLNLEPTSDTRYNPPSKEIFNNNSNYTNNIQVFINKTTYVSPTNFLIWIDNINQKVNIFQGSSKDWLLIKSVDCSSGKPSTPTVKGTFYVQEKGEMFRVGTNTICKYYTQFYGNYLFHTVLLDNEGNIQDPTLGTPVSHGCVRLSIEDAKFIYENIPKGTLVLSN